MIDLADLRMPAHLAEQLRWYWSAAEREMGLRSNFEAVIQASLTTRNKGSKPVSNSKPASYTGAQLEDASDVRWIEGVLARVGRTHRRTLSAVYGPGLPEEAQQTWGWLRHHSLPPALLLVTAERHEISRTTLKAWRVRNTTKGQLRVRRGSMLERLVDEAEAALILATRAYVEAHRTACGQSRAAQLFGPEHVE